MKDKLNKFMQGRYGVDQFARFTLGVALFCIVIGSFLRTGIAGEILDMLGFILIIYTYYRILSRNVSARYGENQKYLGYTQNIRNRFDKEKNMMQQTSMNVQSVSLRAKFTWFRLWKTSKKPDVTHFAYTLETSDLRFPRHFLQNILKDLRCSLLQQRNPETA